MNGVSNWGCSNDYPVHLKAPRVCNCVGNVDTIATPAAQRSGGRPPALGELLGGMTAKDYFAKQEKICIFANKNQITIT